MQRYLDRELAELNTDFLKMAILVQEAIHKSIEALTKSDKALALKVIEEDSAIDEMELKIEEKSVDILALFQPVAGDLRFITTGLHINTTLERIADMTVNIAQRTLDLGTEPLIRPLENIAELAKQAKVMLKEAIDSFVKRNEELAKTVIFSDVEANRLRTFIIKELIDEYIVKDSACARRAVQLLFVARDLERICDHAASIAEDVIYIIEAKVIKHHFERI
jgi:phosphate transport system protein